jgi:hypothetical protein
MTWRALDAQLAQWSDRLVRDLKIAEDESRKLATNISSEVRFLPKTAKDEVAVASPIPVADSGLFVGETGVEANHHFLISKNTEPFNFIEGQYRLDVYAHLLGDRNRSLLFSQSLNVSAEEADAIGQNDAGLYFDWSPHETQYLTHLDQE